jgi:hypothetical protein
MEPSKSEGCEDGEERPLNFGVGVGAGEEGVCYLLLCFFRETIIGGK